MRKNLLPMLTLFVVSLISAGLARADVRLPAVIDSHMVLQRDMPLPIWGWADADETVSVQLDDGTAVKTKADAKGKWKVTLPAVKADGKSHKLTISGNNKITLEDILIGEVWVGSGQSNMEWQLAGSTGGKEAIAAAKHPRIRLFHVPKVQKPIPADDVEADWTVCSPKSVGSFSGVLYFFGLRLQKELDVPVGLINSSWGGSPIEPWIVTDKGSGDMYDGMIAPLKPLAVRGAIWYQGETNVMRKNGLAYYGKMKDLIEGWRKVWGQDLSFYFVQIAPWSGRYEKGQLPSLWEAQVASLKIPGTGMAVTTDVVDNIGDIHPRNKLDVGNRLALWALAKDYGKTDLVYSGPLYKSMEIDGNKIRLKFAHVGGGLKSRDGKPLSEFKIAAADGQFKPATATIDGDTVVVQAEGVEKPTQVQFGWHKVCNPNLMNEEGLPASPFQTNNWQGGTGE
ncbi:MAG: sialate O-acetylesterase [Thermoguttaceae bacterium]